MQCSRSEVGGVAEWGAGFNTTASSCFLTATLSSRMNPRTAAAIALQEPC